MDITVQRAGPNTILKVSGDADVRGLRALEQALSNVSRSATRRVILDLGDVSYIASPGIALLVRFRDHFEKLGGRMALADLPAKVHGILQVTKLGTHFLIFRSVDQALAQFAAIERKKQ